MVHCICLHCAVMVLACAIDSLLDITTAQSQTSPKLPVLYWKNWVKLMSGEKQFSHSSEVQKISAQCNCYDLSEMVQI